MKHPKTKVEVIQMCQLSWRAAAVTDRGLVRKENQDQFYMSPDNRLFAVADGMGGADNGAVASHLAVETVKKHWLNSRPERYLSGSTQEWLTEAVSDANLTIYGAAHNEDIRSKMGTTLVVAAQTEDNLIEIAHVGDSRAYLVRDGKARTLTVDHSVVMEMHMRNQLTKEQARDSIYRNLLTRCLGHENDVEIDKNAVEARDGDWIVLCSDGLNSELKDEEIGKLVAACNSPEDACRKLLERALKAGGRDNVTILVIQYEKMPVPSAGK